MHFKQLFVLAALTVGAFASPIEVEVIKRNSPSYPAGGSGPTPTGGSWGGGSGSGCGSSGCGSGGSGSGGSGSGGSGSGGSGSGGSGSGGSGSGGSGSGGSSSTGGSGPGSPSTGSNGGSGNTGATCGNGLIAACCNKQQTTSGGLLGPLDLLSCTPIVANVLGILGGLLDSQGTCTQQVACCEGNTQSGSLINVALLNCVPIGGL